MSPGIETLAPQAEIDAHFAQITAMEDQLAFNGMMANAFSGFQGLETLALDTEAPLETQATWAEKATEAVAKVNLSADELAYDSLLMFHQASHQAMVHHDAYFRSLDDKDVN